MQFNMKCETFVRLNEVLRYFKPNDDRKDFKSILIECKAGHITATATNGLVLACEFIGPSDGPNASMNLTIDPALLKQCAVEASMSGLLNVIYVEQLKYATIKTTFGYQYPGNGALFFEKYTARDKWRAVINKRVDPHPMIIEADRMAELGRASPTGNLVFPTDIDGSCPVIVTDAHADNWFGMFMPSDHDHNGNRVIRPAATYPEWIK